MSRQQKRLQRESEIINASMELLQQTSFLDLRMSEVAKTAECSMGVIYSHFSSKEDLLVACCHSNLRSQMTLLDQVLNSGLPPKDVLVSSGLMMWHFDSHYPIHYQLRQLAMNPAVWHRASPSRNQAMDQLGLEIEEKLVKVALEILEAHPKHQADIATANQIVFGSWGLTCGLFQIKQSGFGLLNPHIKEKDGVQILLTNLERFFIGWKLDDENTAQRLLELNLMAENLIAATIK